MSNTEKESEYYAISRMFDAVSKFISSGDYTAANDLAKTCCSEFMSLARVTRKQLDSPYGELNQKQIGCFNNE